MSRFARDQFAALFEPQGVVVAGVSSHPGKFGFVALHNLLAGGYKGRIYATNRQGESVLGIATMRSIDELPHGAADLVFVGDQRRLDRSRHGASPRPARRFPASSAYVTCRMI